VEWVRAAQKMGVKLVETRYLAGQTPIEVRKCQGHLDICGLWQAVKRQGTQLDKLLLR